MARPRRKSARKGSSEEYTLVRGADGALYLISETKKPRELKGKKKVEAQHILDHCEHELSEKLGRLYGPPGIKNFVHVGVPTVFVKHE